MIQYNIFLVQYIDYEMKNKINGPAAMLIRCLVNNNNNNNNYCNWVVTRWQWLFYM